MPEERFFRTIDQILFDVPFTRPKEVAEWEQREKIIQAQKDLQTTIRSSGAEIARRVETGQMAERDARSELTRTLKTAIYGFIDSQRGIEESNARSTKVQAAGFQAVIESQEYLGRVITVSVFDSWVISSCKNFLRFTASRLLHMT